MKNQYFGDINDYRKYGLIRLLTGAGILKTAVCWMLTPDDPPRPKEDGAAGGLDNTAPSFCGAAATACSLACCSV